MNRKASFIGALVAVLFPIGPLVAQTPNDHNEGSRLSYDSTNEIWRFKWWGRAGKSYFIQHSEDLMSWQYLPLLETGGDGVLEWGFTSTGDKLFLRLKIYDDPFGTDSDGDGMSDAYEVLNGLDPNNPNDAAGDIDGDGRSNLTEYLMGSDPVVADGENGAEFGASGLKVFTLLE